MADDWTGRTIDGRYVTESILGTGGMGVVLRAHHRFTGARVAVKVLRPELAIDREVQARFLAEARASNAIGHPGIVQVIDAGQAADGPLYLVMELLEGESLRVPMVRGDLSSDEVRRIVTELLDALAAAHTRGFVHRDLKPENVFLVGRGRAVKLLDFGIAKVLDDQLAARTATGMMMGTVAYMAPEQLDDASTVDARADLWAVGVIVFEMLAGELPLEGATMTQLLSAVASREPQSIRRYVPAAPPALDAWFARALARDPARRFGSAREMSAALAGVPLLPIARSSSQVPPTLPPSAITAAPSPAPAPVPATAARTPHDPAATRGEDSSDAVPRRRSRLLLPIIGAVIIGAAVIAGMVMTRDRAVVATPRDAAIDALVIDAAELADATLVDASNDPCERGCAAADACGIRLGTCVEDCRTDPRMRRCVDLAATDCNAAAQCGFAIVCKGVVPAGTGTCEQAALCQATTCPPTPDFTCGCDCASRMSPAHAQLLLQIDVCLINCNFEKVCFATKCMPLAGPCMER